MADDEKNNDEKAEALIASLSEKMIEAILPKITESVEGQIKGISEKNDELLSKLAEAKGKSQNDKLLEAAEAAMQSRKTNTTEPFKKENMAAVQIKRTDARDTATYRAAKAEAEKRGVGLEIIGDE